MTFDKNSVLAISNIVELTSADKPKKAWISDGDDAWLVFVGENRSKKQMICDPFWRVAESIVLNFFHNNFEQDFATLKHTGDFQDMHLDIKFEGHDGATGNVVKGKLSLNGHLEKITYLQDDGGEKIVFVVAKATMDGTNKTIEFEHPKITLKPENARKNAKPKLR